MSTNLHKAIEQDFEGHMDFYEPDTTFPCIFCDFETNDPLQILYHLNDHHQFCINRLSGLAMLQNYLNYWQLHAPTFITMDFYGEKRKTIDPENEDEKSIRATLHKLRLDHIMLQHEQERTVVQKDIPCLFCSKTFTGTWHQYLQWLFEVHGFNPGRPANLVYIPHLVNYLQKLLSNNQCIHCYQKFQSQQQLRSHMKKKPHDKIPNEKKFDRYYMVNYLEEDRKWHDIEKESDEEIEETLEDGLKDFDEVEIDETQCLICDAVLSEPTECIQHMHTLHGFDFNEVKNAVGNDFYHLVRFVNYARQMKKDNKCFICGENVIGNYSDHVCQHKHKAPLDTSTILGDDKFLKPVIDADPLLTVLEDTEI
ncbi:Zinc finger, C2H2 type family protein [Trichomonas vaginalis G3]|uniref:Zinc finger, C2H2 type family protein n=1 Tax=Trichomonas vaginalis (strain ATCC PRA-98 / G3) TaxID=412133 RepID=A2FY49_TRIV3|nr:RNA polymerase II core promoter sequence-specific DNA binding [Trichomonas vaginalis G3]EAX90159.1 Zinc finger, C2H2 type family protein [Trichomonas vaginalis G3]KAI5530364.1 RNA polymerase II core promoter sequence-specific DNA binding [Trichomonas vaginalis G3]|eukprot:XP_001303089.1 Zinc finger, C2H2 type family protein [Trichomonas vaginalis G3]